MKIDENSYYWQRKSSYLLNNLRNFNAVFRKGTTYGNTKSHKKNRVSPSSWKIYFWKNHNGGQLPPPLPLAILELKRLLFINSEKFHCYISNQKATLYWSLLCLQVLKIRVATAENYIVKEQFLKANITQ